MAFDEVQLHDKESLAGNNYKPLVLVPERKGVIKLFV